MTPAAFNNRDGIFFSPMDDLSVFLNLTATTDMTYSSTMSVTTNPVMSGANIADNYSRNPKTINISGVVIASYTGIFLMTKDVHSVEDFIATVERWRNQQRLVRVMCQDGVSVENAVINNFTGKKDKTITNGLQVELTFTQIDIVKEATKGTIQSTSQSSNKAVKTTKTKAVESKQEIGKTSTQKSDAEIMCRWLSGRSVSELSKVSGALSEAGKCDNGQTNFKNKDSTFDYSPNPKIFQEVKDMVGATGVNKTLQPSGVK